jgi:protein-S-isoprenylcysteine O-methyltransferase Ste14
LSEGADNPGVIVFPPLLFAGTLILGLLLQWVMPWYILPHLLARSLGVLLVITSILTASWARTVMRKAGTNINPSKPSLAIVTEGPFRFSRNPLYLSLLGLYLGITLLFNTVWPLLLVVPLLIATHYGIIRREERYLEAKFGDSYRSYKTSVRRWF